VVFCLPVSTCPQCPCAGFNDEPWAKSPLEQDDLTTSKETFSLSNTWLAGGVVCPHRSKERAVVLPEQKPRPTLYTCKAPINSSQQDAYSSGQPFGLLLSIRACCVGERSTHGGFVWLFRTWLSLVLQTNLSRIAKTMLLKVLDFVKSLGLWLWIITALFNYAVDKKTSSIHFARRRNRTVLPTKQSPAQFLSNHSLSANIDCWTMIWRLLRR